MKRVILIFMVLLVAVMPWSGSVVLAASPYPVAWIRQFGTGNWDDVRAVAVDSSGNVYVAGITGGTLPGQSSAGGIDAFLRKYNNAGSEQWTRQFGTSDTDYAFGVAVDSSGNVYVAGGTPGTLPGQSSSGGIDAFLRKYNSAGSEQWTRQFGSNMNDGILGVAVDSLGNVFVAGETGGTLPGQSSAGATDAFIRKYSSAGSEQWTRQFGTVENDWSNGVAVDSSGNASVVGVTEGTLPGQNAVGNSDAFVRKYNSAGVEQWTRQFGAFPELYANGVATDASGNIYVAGNLYGNLPGQSSAGGIDAFLRKYNSAGSEQWTRQFGTAGDDSGRGIAVDSTGNACVVGETGGALPGQSSAGAIDAFMRKYDSAGSEQWTRQFGTNSSDYAYDVAIESSGNVFVAGYTEGAFPGQSSAGLQDAFLAKFVPQSRILYPAEYRWSTIYTPKSQLAPSPATLLTWQQVRFENKGVSDAYNVTATITWVPANVTIADGQVSLGNIAAGGTKWSTDDFALVIDMTNPQPSNQGMLWRVEYDDVLGGHHVMENVPQLTKGAVDPQQTGGKSR